MKLLGTEPVTPSAPADDQRLTDAIKALTEPEQPEQSAEQGQGEPDGSPEETPAESQSEEQGESEGETQKDPKSEIKRLLARDREASQKKREASASAQAKPVDVEALRARAKESPLSVLEELGVHPADVVAQYFLPGQQAEEPKAEEPKLPAVAALEEKIAKLEQRLADESAQKQRADALKSAHDWIDKNKEQYEFLASTPTGAEFLLDTMVAKWNEDRDYYQSTGTAPTFEDIAEGVEAYIEEQYVTQLQWMAQRKKLNPVLAELIGKNPKNPTAGREPKKRSLTLASTAESPGHETADTEDERIALAIRTLEAS